MDKSWEGAGKYAAHSEDYDKTMNPEDYMTLLVLLMALASSAVAYHSWEAAKREWQRRRRGRAVLWAVASALTGSAARFLILLFFARGTRLI